MDIFEIWHSWFFMIQLSVILMLTTTIMTRTTIMTMIKKYQMLSFPSPLPVGPGQGLLLHHLTWWVHAWDFKLSFSISWQHACDSSPHSVRASRRWGPKGNSESKSSQRPSGSVCQWSFCSRSLLFNIIWCTRSLLFNICYSVYLWHLVYLCYLQNRALLNTLRKLRTTGGAGHIAVFNTLAIGHTKHPGEQRISSWPFAVKKLMGSNRQDFVFIRPIGISHGAFALRMDNVWFCKVLLLFEAESESDLR